MSTLNEKANYSIVIGGYPVERKEEANKLRSSPAEPDANQSDNQDNKISRGQEVKKSSEQDIKKSRHQEFKRTRRQADKKSKGHQLKKSRRVIDQYGKVRRPANITIREEVQVAFNVMAAQRQVKVWTLYDQALTEFLDSHKTNNDE